MLKAVFFDFDHTLHDLQTPFHASVGSVFGPLCRGSGIAVTDLKHHLGAVWPQLWRRYLAGEVAEAALYREWFGAALPLAGIALDPERVGALAARYLGAFEAGLCLYPDAMPAFGTLRAARSDLIFGLLTNGPAARQRRRVSAVGLDRWFPVQVVSEEVGFAKPHPGFFAAALERAGVAASEAVMVGDDPGTDIAGAKRAGLRAVWLNREGVLWPADLGVVPDSEARHLGEAVEIVLRLCGGPR